MQIIKEFCKVFFRFFNNCIVFSKQTNSFPFTTFVCTEIGVVSQCFRWKIFNYILRKTFPDFKISIHCFIIWIVFDILQNVYTQWGWEWFKISCIIPWHFLNWFSLTILYFCHAIYCACNAYIFNRKVTNFISLLLFTYALLSWKICRFSCRNSVKLLLFASTTK